MCSCVLVWILKFPDLSIEDVVGQLSYIFALCVSKESIASFVLHLVMTKLSFFLIFFVGCFILFERNDTGSKLRKLIPGYCIFFLLLILTSDRISTSLIMVIHRKWLSLLTLLWLHRLLPHLSFNLSVFVLILHRTLLWAAGARVFYVCVLDTG